MLFLCSEIVFYALFHSNSAVDVSLLPVEVMPLVHRFTNAETAHRWGIVLAKYGLTPPFGYNRVEYPELETTVFGKKFRNPVGLAAGFDKGSFCFVFCRVELLCICA